MSIQGKYNISSSEYYNDSINETYVSIFSKYNNLITDYLKHCLDNIYIQNSDYKKYIVRQGINTIKSIFKMLLIYTKNLDMTYYNCQKGYIYFIEFIGQISEDNHSFLQLNSKDASLFVYKKTIFELNNDTTKNYKSDNNIKNLMTTLNPLINIYNSILFKLINDNNLNDIIKIANIEFQKIIQKIIKTYIEINNVLLFEKLDQFISNYKDNDILEKLDIFIKKIKKIELNNKNIELNVIDNQTDNTQTTNKYINNIINNL